jgi:hypothetical protein
MEASYTLVAMIVQSTCGIAAMTASLLLSEDILVVYAVSESTMAICTLVVLIRPSRCMIAAMTVTSLPSQDIIDL